VRILAIETSTMLGGAAVVDSDAGVLAEVRVNVKAAHSGRLMAQVDSVLRQAGLSPSGLDALAVATGPGSFTGLRIGLGTAKGMAFATGLPLVAVPTLESFASVFMHARHPVCPMLDARKKEVYAALFAFDETGDERLMPEAAIRPRELAEKLLPYPRVILTGEGARLYGDVFTEVLGDRALFAPHHLMVPSAAAVASLGLRMAAENRYEDPAALSPRYVRKSEAELKSGEGNRP
jgi:tRNA threonylcarbamoyladenosine biosynthesis protein TsaB